MKNKIEKKLKELLDFLSKEEGRSALYEYDIEPIDYIKLKLKKSGFKVRVKEVSSVDVGPAGCHYTYQVSWIEGDKIKDIEFEEDLSGNLYLSD